MKLNLFLLMMAAEVADEGLPGTPHAQERFK